MTTPTPMMQQWHDCKKNAQNALLLFQMGDFYEVFYEDAITAARELDLTLTKRQETPMAGVPVHTLDGYVDKLVAKGYRVAIAAQVEDPKQVKGLVKREVVRIITPGTVQSSSALQEKANNYFASINQVGALFGLAFIDLSTGEFKATEFEDYKSLHTELFRLKPAEIYTSEKFKEKHGALLSELKLSFNCLITTEENWRFDHKLSYETLLTKFKVQSLDGFGLKGKVASINAAGGLVSYLQDTLLHSLDHLDEICTYSTCQFMALDSMTQANLEIVESKTHGKISSLLSVLDHTNTSMGGRLLRQMLLQPLLSCGQIHHRHEAVGALVEGSLTRRKVSEHLSLVRDVERLIAKVCTNAATPKDLQAISSSFKSIPFLKDAVFEARAPLLHELAEKLEALPEMTTLIDQAIADEPPLRVSDGGVIRPGFNSELDDYRLIRSNSKEWIAKYQCELRETYGIKTLKVGYNRMFGYYIEVSKGQTDKMPDSFQRRQTLVNAERYISPELKEYEGKVMSAEERIGAIEAMLFQEIKVKLVQFTASVKRVSSALALLDALTSLATAAFEQGYVRPVVNESTTLEIEGGRHPVIERSTFTEKFTPNDTLLNDESDRLILLTGPNMAGKSTYIRQVAIITLMAQVGSFVPAASAKIGLVDKIFTRIGASDDLSRGQSTFMVEMTETANILNNATDRSLVILDEIGRGTSTYDGISIAWAVAEYLLTAEGKRAKTLFATHYWELTKLEELIPGAVNYNVAVQEIEDHIVFLHKIIRGGTDRSYGIHVARLAGMPGWVLERSNDILSHLEENVGRRRAFEPTKARKKPPAKKDASKEEQLTFF